MARAFTALEYVLVGREEYDKLTADHAEVAELRARNERQKRGIRQFADALGQERQRAEKAESDVVKAIAQRDASRAELEQCRALLNAVETIKKTGGAVQIAGVRIEPCDTYGKTDTTRAVDALLDQAEADAVTIDRLIRDRDNARHESQQTIRALGEKLDEIPLWFGLQDVWLTPTPGHQ